MGPRSRIRPGRSEGSWATSRAVGTTPDPALGPAERVPVPDGANCVLEHLGHLPQRWSELARVLEDDRAYSAWEWLEERAAYVEVTDWTPPD